MKKYVSILTFILSVASCKKDHPAAITLTGSFNSTISPATAVQSLDLIDAAKHDTIRLTPDPNTGSVRTTGLAEGKYTLHFEVNDGYVVPADSVISVSGGKTLNLKTFVFSITPIYSEFHFTDTDGPAFNYSVSASYVGSTFYLKAGGSIPYHDGLGDDGEGYSIKLTLNNVNGLGTYLCPGTSNSSMNILLIRQALAAPGGYWNCDQNGGSATVTISSWDPATRMISGTFSAQLTPGTTRQYKNQNLGNGSFKISYH